MDDNDPRSLILLTYKGKVLLTHRRKGPGDEEKHPWSFISGARGEKELGIKIENVECISESYYHAKLTDDNVNRIERAENQILEFFSPRELESLPLTDSTRQFISKHSILIE